VDAVVAILVVGAAIALLVGTQGTTGGPPDPEPTLQTLSTSATAVEYDYAPGRRAEPVLAAAGSESGSHSTADRRTASGTFTGLLARATLSTLSIDDRTQPRADSSDFRDAVRTETRSALPPRTQVALLWRPYPDAHVRARLTVGPAPPPDADLSSASTSVSSGMSVTGAETRTAARTGGYAGLSRVLADRIVAGAFPPRRTEAALRGGYPVAPAVARRYHRLGDAYGVDVEAPVSERRPTDANARLAGAVAERIEADLRASFDAPSAAARAVRLGRVDLVVRRWS
jgi:hypothetical protein